MSVTEGGESARAKTLWTTFLACAFLLPLTIVCALSAAVLRYQRHRRDHHEEDLGASPRRLPGQTSSSTRHGAGLPRGEVETTQNLDNDGRRQRELTVVVMASTVLRTTCWLPLQIFVLADVFAPPPPEPEMETPAAAGAEGEYRRKWELFCVCAALAGSCLSLPLLRVASSECRDAFRLVLHHPCRRRRRRRVTGNQRSSAEAVRRYRTEPPSSHRHLHSPAATMMPRQLSCQPDDLHDFDPGRPKHLSLPPNGRLSMPDVNETILSIISDSSNHINYA